MAMAANSSVSNRSPTSSPSFAAAAAAAGGGDGGGSSPSSRRRLQSPWAQVVRGVELESSSGASAAPRSPTVSPPIPAVDSVPPENNADVESSAPEAESNDNAAGSKKPVWRKPLDGVVEGTSVMGGAISWPALSESTRLTGKSLPADSSSSTKPVLNGSTPISQGPLIAQTPQKPANTYNNANANHGLSRQKSMRNRGAAQGGSSRPLPSPPTPPPMPPLPFPSNEASFVNYGNFVPPPVLDSPMRGARPLGGVVGPPAGNDHSTHSHSSRNSRRNNFGGRPRGDGQYHGGRRDHDRRDGHLPHGPPQFAPPPPPGSYMPPPPPSPGSAPFIPPHPMRPFVPPMGYDMPPPPSFLYVPTLPPYMAPPPPPPMFYPPVVDPPRSALIVKQIDYYFSDSNLVKDNYLRSNMDDEGWVSLDLIADFPRVQQLQTDIHYISESLRGSMVVEIKEGGDKVRRRNDWRKWIHTGGSHVSPKSGPQVSGTSPEALSNSINKMSLDEGTSNGNGDGALDSGLESAGSRPSPDDLSSPNDSSAAGSSIMANGDASPEELHANSSQTLP